ncbi:MAG: hypothetical protein IPJ12_04065 [Betaproteobacteria bacterium]|nr:hypothetical protein [Betaproteobacteria bacterium]
MLPVVLASLATGQWINICLTPAIFYNAVAVIGVLIQTMGFNAEQALTKETMP